jgi:AcrR family transcriptional regulator
LLERLNSCSLLDIFNAIALLSQMKSTIAPALRKRDDPRRAVTQVALIEAAERLFADDGTDAVSTRQIGAAIGSLNTNVVAYHFGNKDGLIEAVFRHRLPEIDRRRGELLAKADTAGKCASIAALLHAFALPLFEQTDSVGRHSYARFLIGLERSGLLAARALVSMDFPHTNQLTARLVEHMPMGAETHGHSRIRLVTSLLASALQLIDQSPGLSTDAARVQFDDALAMSAAALSTPVSKGSTP